MYAYVLCLCDALREIRRTFCTKTSTRRLWCGRLYVRSFVHTLNGRKFGFRHKRTRTNTKPHWSDNSTMCSSCFAGTFAPRCICKKLQHRCFCDCAVHPSLCCCVAIYCKTCFAIYSLVGNVAREKKGHSRRNAALAAPTSPTPLPKALTVHITLFHFATGYNTLTLDYTCSYI